MYLLYDGLQDGGVFVRAAFEEAGIPYQQSYIDLRKNEHLSAEFTRINPRQQVPVLRLDDGTILTETVAIMMHIADCHPQAELLPPLATIERSQAVRWLLFLATNVYEGESRMVHPERYATDPACAPSVRHAAVDYVNRHYLIFEDVLSEGPYLFGDRVSLVDLYLWMLLQWHGHMDWLNANCPKILRLVRAVMARPRIEPIHLEIFGPGIGLSSTS